jgi:hypothetical protein
MTFGRTQEKTISSPHFSITRILLPHHPVMRQLYKSLLNSIILINPSQIVKTYQSPTKIKLPYN